MTKQETIEAIRERARKNFSRGYNCAECVAGAVLHFTDTGLPPEVCRVATGFGGGMGLFGDTCGAISGAIIAVGAVHGRSALPEAEGKEGLKKAVDQLYGKPGLYRLFNRIPNSIKDKYGHTLCRDLISRWKDAPLSRDQALFCRGLIMDAAQIAAELALSGLEEAASGPFGSNVDDIDQEQEPEQAWPAEAG